MFAASFLRVPHTEIRLPAHQLFFWMFHL